MSDFVFDAQITCVGCVNREFDQSCCHGCEGGSHWEGVERGGGEVTEEELTFTELKELLGVAG